MVATGIHVSPVRSRPVEVEVEVGPLERAEIPAVLDVLARSMRDNPMHVAV